MSQEAEEVVEEKKVPKVPVPDTAEDYEELVTVSSRFLNFLRLGDSGVNKSAGVEFNAVAVDKTEVPEFEDEPYYLMRDETEGYRNNHNLSLSMTSASRPTLNALVETCRAERDSFKVLFKQGMWVEYRSKTMDWKVGVVNRVIKQAPDEWDFRTQGKPKLDDFEIYYNIGLEGLLDVKQVRAPEDGLKFIFGNRPWLWQQFALLKLERRLRFDGDHEHDFEEIDNIQFASKDFRLWLESEKNTDFKELYDAQSPMTQFLLRKTLLSPFMLLDDIVEDEVAWNFNDHDIGVYTYLGVLGSGLPMALVAFGIQVLSPLILLYNVLFLEGDQPNTRFEIDPRDTAAGLDPEALSGNFIPNGNFDDWCAGENQNPREEGKVLIIVVLFVYLSTVIPESFVTFFRTSGGSTSTFSKISSLRNIVWYQNDDNAFQMIGFKMDRLMNTGYVAILYSVMIFILIQTPVILDIILNALAIDFIHEIDQNIVKSSWWDSNKRFIKAGTMELVLQSTLRLNIIRKPKAFCRHFGIDYEEYCEALGGSRSLKDKYMAKRDDRNFRHMSKKERVYFIVAENAEKQGRRYNFIKHAYRKVVTQFGVFDKLLLKLGIINKGIFGRYPEFRTWSRWEKVLFLPRLPLDEEESSKRLAEKLAYGVKIGHSATFEFVTHVIVVATGVEFISQVLETIWKRRFTQLPIKILLSFFEFIFYVIQLSFPLTVVFGLFLVPYCY